MQQLQFEAFDGHHSPEAAVVPVDGQREALVEFWERRDAKISRGDNCWGGELRKKPPGSENPGLDRGRPLTWGAGVLHDVRPVFLRLILDRRQRKGQSKLTIPGLEFKANLELPYRAGVREVKLNVGIQVVGLNSCRIKKKCIYF